MRHGQKLLYATAIRLLVIPVKFLFVFYLASAIDLTSLGQYALVAALSSYCIYIVGLEVHSHVNRLGIGGSRREWNELLSNQMGLYALTSTIFVATTLLAEHYNIISVPYVYFFIAITIAEHFGQESYRTLISLQDQLFASITLFIRSALWPIITIAYGLLGGKVSLDLIFSLWTACGVTGSIVGYIYIATTYAQGSKFRIKISKSWMANAIKVSSIFLLCTLTLRIAQTADRYMVSLFESAETLGVYSFYVMIALSISSVLVFIGPGRIYPELIIAKKKGDWQAHRTSYKKMLTSGLLFSVTSATIALSAVYIGSSYSLHEVFEINGMKTSVITTFLGVILITYNLCLQYLAYSLQQDKGILASNAISVASALSLLALFSYYSTVNVNTLSLSIAAFYLAGIISKKILISLPYGEEKPR